MCMRFITPSAFLCALVLVLSLGSGLQAAERTLKITDFDFGYGIGSIVIVNEERALYYQVGEQHAIRYPVAVGKPTEIWVGKLPVAAKLINPPWTPVDGGATVPGGHPQNPLGKRALYLGWTLWRIHGTPATGSIGQAVSNGCIRMLNEDIADLYPRVHLGAPVYVVQSRSDLGKTITSTRKLSQMN